jgi:hypothetical protein
VDATSAKPGQARLGSATAPSYQPRQPSADLEGEDVPVNKTTDYLNACSPLVLKPLELDLKESSSGPEHDIDCCDCVILHADKGPLLVEH